jgi:hypothetical protein
VDRVLIEDGGLGFPDFADIFMRRQASQSLQPFRKIVGGQEGCEMLTQLVVAVVVIAEVRILSGAPIRTKMRTLM